MSPLFPLFFSFSDQRIPTNLRHQRYLASPHLRCESSPSPLSRYAPLQLATKLIDLFVFRLRFTNELLPPPFSSSASSPPPSSFSSSLSPSCEASGTFTLDGLGCESSRRSPGEPTIEPLLGTRLTIVSYLQRPEFGCHVDCNQHRQDLRWKATTGSARTWDGCFSLFFKSRCST